MSANTSLPQLVPTPLLSNSSLHGERFNSCSMYPLCVLSTVYILILPVFIFVLYLGYQRHSRQHSDLFTYHSIAMQLNEFVGFTVFWWGMYFSFHAMIHVGQVILGITFFGKALFHLLTCAERYLAVVYPITYLGLKQAGGVRMANISIGWVWILSFLSLSVCYPNDHTLGFIFTISFTFFLLAATSFCSISVLCVLKSSGPGKAGGNKKRVDQTKQRAFYTVMAIMGVLLFRFGASLMIHINIKSQDSWGDCVRILYLLWADLPSTLVLPLLFLHRAGKLPCCKQNKE